MRRVSATDSNLCIADGWWDVLVHIPLFSKGPVETKARKFSAELNWWWKHGRAFSCISVSPGTRKRESSTHGCKLYGPADMRRYPRAWTKLPKSSRINGHKGVNQHSKYVTQTQQRPESPTVTVTWHECKYRVHNSTRSTPSPPPHTTQKRERKKMPPRGIYTLHIRHTRRHRCAQALKKEPIFIQDRT